MAGTSGINRLIGGSQHVSEILNQMSETNFQEEQVATDDTRDGDQESSKKELGIHGAKLAEKFLAFQKQDKLCDITIIIGGRSFRAHKMVLAVASEYFETMFSGSFVESSKSEVEIDGDSKAFERLLQFAYTGELELADGGVNLWELLKLASYMQFADIVEKYSKVLLKDLDGRKLSIDDVFEITALTKSHGKTLDKLHPSALWCLALDFKEFVRTGAFLDDLCAEVFEDVLKKPDVACSMTEAELLASLVKWLSHDLAKRRPHGLQLVKHLRLGTIPMQDIDNARKFFHKNDMKDCCQILPRRRKTKDGDLVDAGQGTPRNIITAPLVTGGSVDNTVMYFDRQQLRWVVPPWNFAPVPALHSGTISDHICVHSGMISDHSCIVVNGVLYVAGGIDISSEDELEDDSQSEWRKVARFYKYHPDSNSWTALASMQFARSHFAMVQLSEDEIYVIGGLGIPDDQGTRAIDEVECYSIRENKWRLAPHIPNFDMVVKPSAVVQDGKILVYGNIVEWPDEWTTDYVLQMYDPEKQQWFKLRDERYEQPKYRDSILTVHDGKCYRIGFVQRDDDDQVYGKVRVSEVTFSERHLRNGQVRPYGVIGKEQHQVELKCKNAFCMGDEVFMFLNGGFVYNTGIKVSEIGPDGFNEEWDKVCMGMGENITTFTFDILKLKPKK